MQALTVFPNSWQYSLQSSLKTGLALLATTTLVGCAFVTRVSVTPTAGVEPDGRSFDPVTSNTGRYVAFASDAENLVANDANSAKDIFVRDNKDKITELVTQSLSGGSANGLSGQPDITADGRYVVYWSFADDLVANDTNAASDVFRYDRQTGTTERVSVATGGGQAAGSSLGGSVSDDGNFVVFYTTAALDPLDTNGTYDIYRRDIAGNTTTLVSKNLAGNAAGNCFDPVISRDGNSLIFWSGTTDITAGDTNGFSDVFFVNTTLGTTTNLTQVGDGHSYTGDIGVGPSPTVALMSSATNLDSSSVDTNGVQDIYVITLAGLFNFTTRVTDGDLASSNPVLAATSVIGGTVLAFNSAATNLQVPGATPQDTNALTDVYVWERTPTTPGGTRTRLISQTFAADLADGASTRKPAISPNGQAIAFPTHATNLSAPDSNGVEDIYIRPRHVPQIESVSGNLQAGQFTLLTLTGEFLPGPGSFQPLLLGDGVDSISVDFLSSNNTSLRLIVSMAANATPGPRTLWIYDDAPDLGMAAPLGSGASVEVIVDP